MSELFQSRPDGEYRLCRICEKHGYGVDAWHPVTREFWPVADGLLQFDKCKACRSERASRKFGKVPVDQVAA